ncbi:hypothetical protein PMAYCL1PPCAC_05937, partial [Pristionchus mayeri]
KLKMKKIYFDIPYILYILKRYTIYLSIRYAKMLLSYVLARRGVKEGPSIFARLLSIIDVVTKLTSWQKSQHILILAMGLYKSRVPFAEAIYHSQ